MKNDSAFDFSTGFTVTESHQTALRRKVENDPSNPAILVSESGSYKLVP
jgi:hypothetical protein